MAYAVYEQRSGLFQILDVDDGGIERCHYECDAYSGSKRGLNNPAMEGVKSVGPIPAGGWLIHRPPYNSPKMGPMCLRLSPVGHRAFGRSAFLIHGDNRHMNRTASNGCIIVPRHGRELLIEWEVNRLTVVRDKHDKRFVPKVGL